MAYAGIGRALVKLGVEAVPLVIAYLYSPAETHSPAPGLTWRRVQLVWQRAYAEDVITQSMDILNITSGEPDSTWTAADFATVEARLTTFAGALVSKMPSSVSLKEYRWHSMPDAPGESPAVRVTPKAGVPAGVSAEALPHQVACSITKVTQHRRHWGRVYVGPISRPSLNADTKGRFDPAMVDQFAAAFNTLRAGLQADDFPMVVYDRTRHLLATVDGVRCDDIPDIIRSRRVDQSPYRKVLP